MPRPKTFGDRATFTVRCDPDLLERIQAVAKKTGRAKNTVVVEALESFLSPSLLSKQSESLDAIVAGGGFGPYVGPPTS